MTFAPSFVGVPPGCELFRTEKDEDGSLTYEFLRNVLERHGRLDGSAAELAPDTNLYGRGLSSHTSFSVMLALEETFGIQFPDRLMRRQTFRSMAALRSALVELGLASS